jgi:hypothetical protein
MAYLDQFKIVTSIDASGVQPGVDKTVDGLKQVEKQTEAGAATAAAAGAKVDASVLSNRRSVTHLLEGLMRLGQGGTEAIGGVAAEGFVATEMFEGMLGPLAPIAMALTLIVSLGIPMFERFSASQAKIDDTKDSADKLTASIVAQGKAAEDALAKEDAALAPIEANFKRMEEYGGKVLSLLNAAIDLQKKRTDEILKGQELEELAKNTGGAAGEAAIKQKYAGLSGQNAAISDEQKNMLDQAHAYGVQQRESAEYSSTQDTLKKRQAEYDRLQDAAHKAEIERKAAGIDPGKDDDFKEAIAALTEQLKNATDAYNFHRSGLEGSGTSTEDEIDSLTKKDKGEVSYAQHLLDLATEGAQAKAMTRPVDTLKADIDKNQAKLDGLADQIKEQSEVIENLRRERDNLSLAAANAKAGLAEKNKTENQTIGDDDFTARNKTKINAQQDIADDKTKPAAREKAELAIGELIAQGFERKAREGAAAGPGNLSQDKRDELISDAEKARVDARGKAGQIGSEDKRKSDSTGKKSDTEQIDKAKGTIEASGNKDTIKAMHLLIEKDQGHTSKLLTDLLALMGQHISTQTQINSGVAQQLTQIKAKQQEHGHGLQNLNHP